MTPGRNTPSGFQGSRKCACHSVLHGRITRSHKGVFVIIRCEFLIQTRGQEYISNIQDAHFHLGDTVVRDFLFLPPNPMRKKGKSVWKTQTNDVIAFQGWITELVQQRYRTQKW